VVGPTDIECPVEGGDGPITIATEGKKAGLVVEIPGRRGVVGTENLLPNFEATSIPLQGFVILPLLVVMKPEQLEGSGYTQMLGSVSFLGDLQSPVKIFAGTFHITTVGQQQRV
jgi:hypothetical protein